MTIREIVVAFGFEIDKGTEKKVNDSIDRLKTFASDALGKTGVGYKVDKSTEKEAKESINRLENAAESLQENSVGFEIDESAKSLVSDSIDDLKEAAGVLEENRVAFQVERQSEKEVKARVNTLRSFIIKALGVIGIGFSLAAMRRLSEEFGGINDKIRDATRSMGDQHDIQQRILRAANDTRQSYAAMANTINRLAMSGAFEGIEEAAQFATLMAQDFAAAGKSQQKSAYLTRYITMDLQKGTVSARTMTTALRDAPHIVNRLANSLDVSVDNLMDMARGGELTADILKNSFLDSAYDIQARFAETDMSISDALTNVRNGWGLFVSQMDDTLGLTRIVANAIVNAFNRVLFVLRRGQEAFTRLADRVGGVNNLLRLLAISAAAVFAALNAKKILGFLKGIARIITRIKLKVLALVAVIVLLALLIEDFLAFMRGDDSLLAKMLENAGINAEAVRETIINAWQAIRRFLSATWTFLRNLGRRIWGGLLRFWEEHGDTVKATLLAVWNTIQNVLKTLWEEIKSIAVRVFGALRDFWDKWGAEILATFLDVFLGILSFIKNIFLGEWSAAFEDIRSITSRVFNLLSGIFGRFAPIVWGLIAAIGAYKLMLAAAALKARAMTVATNVLAAATKTLNAVKKANPIGIIIALIVGLIAAFVTLWQTNEGFRNFFISIWEGIRDFFSGVVEFFRNAFNSIIEFFTEGGGFIGDVFRNIVSTISTVIESIIQIISGLINFIVGVFTGDWERAWEGIRNIFSGIVSGLGALFKLPLNAIIAGLNVFIRGLNRLRIPDWVPGVGGKGLNIPEIPMLAKGSDSSPDTFIAGEEGPELITNAKGSKVFTAVETADTLDKMNALANWKPPAEEEPKNMFGKIVDFAKRLFGDKEKSMGFKLAAKEKPINPKPAAEVYSPPALEDLDAFAAQYAVDISETLKNISSMEFGLAKEDEYPKYPKQKPEPSVDSISMLLQNIATAVFAPPDDETLVYHSHVENKAITQYNEFYSEFHGDRAGQEQSAAAMDRATDDATGELARALAYVR